MKKTLIAVSFGTSFAETREKTIGAIERRMAERLPEYIVQRSFTSRIIRKKLLERDNLRIDSPEEAVLKALASAPDDDAPELVVQPMYLMHGIEHRRLMDTLGKYRDSFRHFAVGKPLLSDKEDFRIMAEAVRRHLPASGKDTAVVLMGHGNVNRKKTDGPGQGQNVQDNAVFRILQDTLHRLGAENYFIATVEGEPVLEDIIPVLKERRYGKIILAPFMVVAGDHAFNDLAGEEDDSWKNILMRNGFETETVLRGIGEWEEVQDLFSEHAEKAVRTLQEETAFI